PAPGTGRVRRRCTPAKSIRKGSGARLCLSLRDDKRRPHRPMVRGGVGPVRHAVELGLGAAGNLAELRDPPAFRSYSPRISLTRSACLLRRGSLAAAPPDL